MAQYIKDEDGTWIKIAGMEANPSIDDSNVTKTNTFSSYKIKSTFLEKMFDKDYTGDVNDLPAGTIVSVNATTSSGKKENCPTYGWMVIFTSAHNNASAFRTQMAISLDDGMYYRNRRNAGWDNWVKIPPSNKVVYDDKSTVSTLYNNDTGTYLKSSLNLTANKSGILKVSFEKKNPGYTINVGINGIHRYAYPNWWGENVYESAFIPVNNGDKIVISSDAPSTAPNENCYRIVNVLII